MGLYYRALYYKVRVLWSPIFGLGPISPFSSGLTPTNFLTIFFQNPKLRFNSDRFQIYYYPEGLDESRKLG